MLKINFVSLPTGHGKSLCLAILPFAVDEMLQRIVIGVSSLLLTSGMPAWHSMSSAPML